MDKLIEFARPERVEFGTQRGQPLWVQAVVLEFSGSPADDEPCVGKHAQVLRDRRPAHGEVTGQLGHGAFATAQELEQAAPVWLRDRSDQVNHDNTLVITNALGNGVDRIAGLRNHQGTPRRSEGGQS